MEAKRFVRSTSLDPTRSSLLKRTTKFQISSSKLIPFRFGTSKMRNSFDTQSRVKPSRVAPRTNTLVTPASIINFEAPAEVPTQELISSNEPIHQSEYLNSNEPEPQLDTNPRLNKARKALYQGSYKVRKIYFYYSLFI
jgi:hypothetical protein